VGLDLSASEDRGARGGIARGGRAREGENSNGSICIDRLEQPGKVGSLRRVRLRMGFASFRAIAVTDDYFFSARSNGESGRDGKPASLIPSLSTRIAAADLSLGLG
jgi:hypothetical protein